MLKLMWKDGHAEWVPVTEQEDAERVEFLKAVDAIPAIPEAEKMLDYFPGGNLDSYGKRTMYQIDRFYAEFYAEKERREQKYLRKHEIRNDGHPVKKEKRKDYEKRKHYNCDFYRGLMTVRKYRELEAEKADARDYAIEEEMIAEFMMWERINKEIEQMRKFAEETEELRKLGAWLEWA